MKRLPSEAAALVREASQALAARNLDRGFRCDVVKEDGVEMLKVQTSRRIRVVLSSSLPGRWHLRIEWLLRRPPGSAERVVWRSTIALNVADVTFAPEDESICFVRYDVDNGRQGPTLLPLGRHLNVLQPAPLDDHVHFPVLDTSSMPWPVDAVLQVFHSAGFVANLEKRLLR